MKTSISVLSSENKELCVSKLNSTDVDYIHIDAMDGIFVENKALTIGEIIKLNKISAKKLDIHLMVANPIEYINKLKNMNIEYITFHIEVEKDINNIINVIKDCGYKVGLAISPKTSLEKLIPYLNDVDLILIMSVEPGKGGQRFIPSTIMKIKDIAKIIKNGNYNIEIEVDGGIKDYNIKKIMDNGVDIAVIGSFVTDSDNYQEQINKLKKLQ